MHSSGASWPNCMNQMELGESISQQCEQLIKHYDDWNATVRGLHDRNSHLYYKEIKIHEPPRVDWRQMRRQYARKPMNFVSHGDLPPGYDLIPPSEDPPETTDFRPGSKNSSDLIRRRTKSARSTISSKSADYRLQPLSRGGVGAVAREHKKTKEKIEELERQFREGLTGSVKHTKKLTKSRYAIQIRRVKPSVSFDV